jgi:hypothetical protein
VNEQQSEQTSGEPGSVGAGPAVPSDAQGEAQAASMQEPMQEPTRVESPALAPEQGTTDDMPKVDHPKADADKADAPRIDAPRTPGRIMIMSAGERAWDGSDARPAPGSEPNSGMFGKRRLAAVVALSALAGALGGAMATAGLGHFAGDDTTSGANRALEASVARIDADIQALKASAEHTSRLGTAQFSKTNERLDKVEKAQAEPAAKLAKLSEAIERLHAAPPVASAAVAASPAAAKDVTGSISPAAAAPKVELARLPTVEGWSLRDVANGGALIEGRQGIFEVYAGDPVPGLGRIDAIRRQDGRWVVVTSKGLIVAR